MPRISGGLLAGVAALCLGAAAHAGDDTSPCAPLSGGAAGLGANDERPGVIDLFFFGAQGAPVTFDECVGGRVVALGRRSAMHDDYTPMYAAAAWSCARRTRRFAATAVLPDGTIARGLTDIRTPSCAQRFRIDAPARAQRGTTVAIRVVDRWGIGGIGTRWCVRPPRSRPACRALRFVAARRVVRVAVLASRRGRWQLSLLVRRHRVRTTVAVGVRSAPQRRLPRILATGDSTMQGVDEALADELAGRADVVSDVHPGAGLSESGGWRPRAHRAAVVVLSIGAAEGFPMNGPNGESHSCCDEGWVAEYTRRMHTLLAGYRHHANVVVLTVVAPRDPRRAQIVAAVDAATVRAASGMRGVRLLRMDRFFTPTGYRETIRSRGRDVAVREPDGIHLNVAGTTIEARKAAPAVRAALSRR